MTNLLNSKRYAFEIAHPLDLEGVIYIQIPPATMSGDWENVRVWVTPHEKTEIDYIEKHGLVDEQQVYSAIFVGQSFIYPMIQWGDEIQIIASKNASPRLDVNWLQNVLAGNIHPTPKNKPVLWSMRSSSKWQKLLQMTPAEMSSYAAITASADYFNGRFENLDFNHRKIAKDAAGFIRAEELAFQKGR